MASEATSGRGSGERAGPDDAEPAPLVRTFHQTLLWPLQILPVTAGKQIDRHWELLDKDTAGIWTGVSDRFGVDTGSFGERNYREFVTFLPYVQRLLYGEGPSRHSKAAYGDSPIKVYRRTDVVRARIEFPDRREPIELDVRQVDLYFFYDIDLVILAVELAGSDLPLDVVQDSLHRFGRAYPAGWTQDGDGINCPRRVEWLAADGRVLSTSDYEARELYLAAVSRERTPPLAAHWQYLIDPLTADHTERSGALRFRHLELYRMPLMAYLAVDHPERLTRGDFARLAYATAPGDRHSLPFSEEYLADFEEIHCYDRYYDKARATGGPGPRIMFCDHTFVVVGDAGRPYFTDAERGGLAQFRHQFFLLALIAHMHKGALLMMSDRLVQAVTRLDIDDEESVLRFRAEIWGLLEIFLRFSHRYWFHDISDHVLTRDVFHGLIRQLNTDRLFVEMREELKDMGSYLDSDLLRRQSSIFLRLTVVTMIGLIGTTTTGFLGMSSLIAATDHHLGMKVLYVMCTATAFAVLTFYTLAKSQRIASFLDALTNERYSLGRKTKALLDIWRDRPR